MIDKIILTSKAKKLEPVLRIGKSGFSENFMVELNKILNKRKLVKIKLLKSSFGKKEKEELINSVVAQTNSELIDSVGNVFVVYRK